MSIDWRNPSYELPSKGSYVVVKYSLIRSDIPFRYLVSLYDGKWLQEYMINGKFEYGELPTPNEWGYVEPPADEEHG